MTEDEWFSATQPEPMLKYLRGDARIFGETWFPALSCGGEPNRIYHGPSRDFPPEKFGPIVDHYLEQLDGLPFGPTDQAILNAFRHGDESDPSKNEFLDLCAANGGIGIHPDLNAALPNHALHWSRSPFGLFQIALAAAVFLTRFEFREQVAAAESGETVRDQLYSPAVWEIPGFEIAFQQRFAELPNLIRCTFGNPFRPVAFDPRWRTSDVVELARGIYEAKAFDKMPMLADALMDAGCEDEQIIAHCKGDGPHVRGCWVVDLILGKE